LASLRLGRGRQIERVQANRGGSQIADATVDGHIQGLGRAGQRGVQRGRSGQPGPGGFPEGGQIVARCRDFGRQSATGRGVGTFRRQPDIRPFGRAMLGGQTTGQIAGRRPASRKMHPAVGAGQNPFLEDQAARCRDAAGQSESQIAAEQGRSVRAGEPRDVPLGR